MAARRGFDPDRLVAVLAADASVSGTGYVLSPGVVVTAASVVTGQRRVVVRLPYRREELEAETVWQDEALDVALLSTPRAFPGHDGLDPVTFRSMEAEQVASVTGRVMGYVHPLPAHGSDTDLPEVGEVPLRLSESTWAPDRLELLADTSLPREPTWAGMSGAPVWVGEAVVGILSASGPDPGRATATRVDPLLDHDEFMRLAQVERAHVMRASGTIADDLLSRLSPSSRSALAYAAEVARTSGGAAVHVEHLLLGLYDKPDGPTRRLVDAAGLDRAQLLAVLADAVELTVPVRVDPEPLTSMPPLSRHVVAAIDAAHSAAAADGSSVLRSRHLLRGILSVEECDVVKALHARGVVSPDVATTDEESPEAVVADREQQPAAPRPRARQRAGATADTIPDAGEATESDRLNAATEADMLVSVLLDRDTPLPMAVGLFGDWGSGKSFFMALMQERIKQLTHLAKEGRPEAAPYCRSVAQIRFNAWHYVDTSLWASLAATLFDGLAREIAPEEAEEGASRLAEAEIRVARATTERERLEHEVDELSARIERVTSAGLPALGVALDAVRHDGALPERLKKVGVDGAEVDTRIATLISVLGNVHGVQQTVAALWQMLREEVLHRRGRTTAVSVLVLLSVVAGVLVATTWSPAAKTLTVVGAALVAVLPALRGATELLRLAREARARREAPLLAMRDELARARQAEAAATREREERLRDLHRIRDKGAELRNFVRERAAGSVYRSQLGTISQVRADFEELVRLMPGGLTAEAGTAATAAGDPAAALRRVLPDVERIFLFIDDLDRCPPEKVVDVLHAVHLLLAFKLFVVVVGVDSRWLGGALTKQYEGLLEEPDNYLEKIFQIPFRLRPMSGSGYRDLIAALTPSPPLLDGASPSSAIPEQRAGSATPSLAAAEAPDGALLQPERQAVSSDAVRGRPTGLDAGAGAPAPAPARVEPAPPALPRPEALRLTAGERALLAELQPLVSTPRAAKRLVNIYRMLRVSVPEQDLDAFLPEGGGEYQAVIVLTGVLVGRPRDATAFFRALMNAPATGDIWDVVDLCGDLAGPLRRLRQHVTVSDIGVYRRWAPRVSRFSFRLAAVLPLEEEAQTARAAPA